MASEHRHGAERLCGEHTPADAEPAPKETVFNRLPLIMWNTPGAYPGTRRRRHRTTEYRWPGQRSGTTVVPSSRRRRAPPIPALARTGRCTAAETFIAG